ncbi:MAG: hypothetical protein HEQ24_24080 [Dolichospermum sp. BR01]|nr:hypothetical protein [Dolichospermum sp. BR01]
MYINLREITEHSKLQNCNLNGAATKLNITEDNLIEALGLPPRRPGDCSQKKE